MKSFNHSGRVVLFNDTADDIYLSEIDEHQSEIEECLFALVNVDPAMRQALEISTNKKYDLVRTKHTQWTSVLIKAHNSGCLILSPSRFSNGDSKMFTSVVAEQFLSEVPLGHSIKTGLSRVGLYTFTETLKDPSTKVTYYKHLTRILASLTMAVSGAAEIEQIPVDVVSTWITYFRTPEGTRWRAEEWNSSRDIIYQCFREVVRAYSRLTGNDEITRMTGQKRSDSTQLYYWSDIEKKTTPHIAPWLTLFRAWRDQNPTFAKHHRQMFQHLISWLNANFKRGEVIDVANFMARRDRHITFTNHIVNRRVEDDSPDRGSGFLNVLGSARRFSDFIAHGLELQVQGRIIYPLVTEAEIRAGQNIIKLEGFGNKISEAKSRPLPMRLYRLTRDILSEGEAGWPGQESACQETVTYADGTAAKVYCPVLPTLFLSIFQLPLRVGQMKRLDSGEGDVDRFDGVSLTWTKNKGPAAGYWRTRRDGPDQRGYAYRFDSTPSVTGFFVNTNKTGAPYHVPWENPELHRLLFELRSWQETYNPSKKPIVPMLYVDGAEYADNGKLTHYPDIFALFRTTVDRRNGRQGAPPNARRTNEFWQKLMREVEIRWNAQNPDSDPIEIVKLLKNSGQAYGALYNPHGMRVAGLTRMAEQGVPIEIISKLIAGHKSVMMTLYYLKFNPARIHEMLGQAIQNENAASVADTFLELRNAAFEAAQRRSACIEEDGLRAAVSMHPTEKTFWSDTGIGICPWDGTRCSDGGAMLRKEGSANDSRKSLHGPVEGGERNCVMCRHFITGPAWQTPLWLYGSKLLRQIAVKSGRAAQLLEEIDDIENEKLSAAPLMKVRLDKDLAMRTVELNGVSAEQEIIGKAIWHTKRLLEKCVEIGRAGLEDESGSGQSLVAQEAHTVIEYLEVTEFEQAAVITTASRVYPLVYDIEAEAACERFLDHVVSKSGGQPISFAPLDRKTKRRGMDALAKLILERVRKSEMLSLTEGSLTLQDLRLENAASAAVSAAVGSPMSFFGVP
jgi:hypothetical protein